MLLICTFMYSMCFGCPEQCGTWLEMKDKLMPNGRIMVNCGGSDVGDPVSDENTWEQNSTIKALCQAFPGEVCLVLISIVLLKVLY